MPHATDVDTAIETLDVSAYTVPTDGPESDGTLEWTSTTLVLVEATAGDQHGLGYTYADVATAELIRDRLADVIRGHDAATRFRDYRLPELYCGYAKHESPAQPIRYPVACSPQAWAAGALPYALWNLLGLHPAATAAQLRIVRPELPELVEWLELNDVRVGRARVDLRWQRAARGRVDVTWQVREGRLDVERVDDRRAIRFGVPMAA